MKKKDVFLLRQFDAEHIPFDMFETNMDELKEQATAFLKQIHPDLVKVKEELGTAIEQSSKELGSV